MIEVEIRSQSPPLRILFSGDVGRYDAPLYHDPHPPTACDYLICESTYGDREHAAVDLLAELAKTVQAAIDRGGVIVVPAFAVGRAQQLIYLLQVLITSGRLPELPIYLDSPMSIRANQVYLQHWKSHDLIEAAGNGELIRARNVHATADVEDSKRINRVKERAVIISSSGMMTGGRILHHLRQRLPDERNTILIGGFQAVGTRGRQLEDGAQYLRIHGQDVPVRAHVIEISGLSGHAGHSELLRWLQELPPPRRVFLTHGEKTSATALADELRKTRQWNTYVPHLHETVELG
jgi:metallo-beta-lactamase family protein